MYLSIEGLYLHFTFQIIQKGNKYLVNTANQISCCQKVRQSIIFRFGGDGFGGNSGGMTAMVMVFGGRGGCGRDDGGKVLVVWCCR